MRFLFAILILGYATLCAQAQVLGAISPDPRDADPAQVSAGNPLWRIRLEELLVTRERPIFSPSRRPPPIAAPVHAVVAPQKPKPETPLLTLVGTVVGDEDAIAVLLDETTKNPLRLRTGEEHDGWVLQSVHARDVLFQKGQKTEMLALPQPAGDKMAAIPPLASEQRARNHGFTYGR
jgi:hypothetical protein